VFRSDEIKNLQAGIATLCVLYEDLRLEVNGIVPKSLRALDHLDNSQEHGKNRTRIGRYRRAYFVRRSIATLREFGEALVRLDGDEDFNSVRSNFDTKLSEQWNQSVNYFKKHGKLIGDVRNDIGGHFGLTAARRALKDEPRLHFAGEIASAGFFRHLNGRDHQDKFSTFLRTVVVPGYTQATSAVQVLIVAYLWPRFGR
jgi:hypothetical protein